jgi:hypothetical protein
MIPPKGRFGVPSTHADDYLPASRTFDVNVGRMVLPGRGVDVHGEDAFLMHLHHERTIKPNVGFFKTILIRRGGLVAL